MADYLTGLVTRVIGTAPTARPRVPTMFEPVAFESSDGTAAAPVSTGAAHRASPSQQREEPLESAADEGAPDAVVPRHRPPDTATVAVTVADPLPERPKASQPASPLAPTAEAARRPSAAASGSATRRRDVVHPHAQSEPPGVTRRDETEPRPSPARVVKRQPSPDREPLQRIREPSQPQILTVADEAPAPPAALAPPVVPVRPRDRVDRSEPGALRPKTRQVDALDVEVAARSNRRAAPPSGQTLVHVSIGRVEVHAPASHPPSEPRRDRPKPPTALDDYLGHRNGTRR